MTKREMIVDSIMRLSYNDICDWALHLKKEVLWSNTTKREVSTAVNALLEKIGNNARINIYTKNGVMNASSTDKENKIKIIIE